MMIASSIPQFGLGYCGVLMPESLTVCREEANAPAVGCNKADDDLEATEV